MNSDEVNAVGPIGSACPARSACSACSTSQEPSCQEQEQEQCCTQYNCTDCNCTDCRCENCNSLNCGKADKAEQTQPLKVYYTYDQIHRLINKKAGEIRECDYIIAIGGGGLIPARMLRQKLNVPIIVVTIRFYDDNDHISSEPDIIQWDPATMAKLVGKRCLIVDEVFDSGSTMEYVVDRLISEGIEDLSVMVIHHKKKMSNLAKKMGISHLLQNYYSLVDVTDEWIVYPWEADDIVEHNRLAESSVV